MNGGEVWQVNKSPADVQQHAWRAGASETMPSVAGKPQLFVLPMNGGEVWQVTKSPAGVQQYAWRPGASDTIAFVAADEPPKVTGEERHNRAFEIQNNHFLLQEGPRPAHVWLIA